MRSKKTGERNDQGVEGTKQTGIRDRRTDTEKNELESSKHTGLKIDIEEETKDRQTNRTRTRRWKEKVRRARERNRHRSG